MIDILIVNLHVHLGMHLINTAEDALAYLVAQSQKLSANAIIGLKIVDVSINAPLPAFTASGMALKR